MFRAAGGAAMTNATKWRMFSTCLKALPHVTISSTMVFNVAKIASARASSTISLTKSLRVAGPLETFKHRYLSVICPELVHIYLNCNIGALFTTDRQY